MRFSKIFSGKVFSGLIAVIVAIVTFVGCSNGVSPVFSHSGSGSGTVKAEVRIPAARNLAKRSALAKSQLVPMPVINYCVYGLKKEGSGLYNYDTIFVSFTGDTTFEIEIDSIPVGIYNFSFSTIGDHPDGPDANDGKGTTGIHGGGVQGFDITDGDTTVLSFDANPKWHKVVCELPPPLPSEVAAAAVSIDNLDQYYDGYDSLSFAPGDYASDTLKIGAPVQLTHEYSRDFRITVNLYDSNNDLCYTGYIERSMINTQDYSFSLTLDKISGGAQGLLKANITCIGSFESIVHIDYGQ